jgi:type II secretory ATPase GspE/PulE/Tfp pilus assembly ATPase PilB-like protein
MKKKPAPKKELMGIVNLIHGAGSIEEIVLEVRDRIVEMFSAQRLTIYAIDPERGQVYSLYKDGKKVKRIRVGRNYSSIVGYCCMTKKVSNIRDAYDDEELRGIHPRLKFDSRWDKATGVRTKEILTAPILHDDQLMGILQLINSEDGDVFSKAEFSAIGEIARTMGIALTNLRQRTTVDRPRKFGYLVDKGFITEKDLLEAVSRARAGSQEISTVLIEKYAIAKEEVLKSLGHFYRTGYFLFDGTQRIPELLKKRLNSNYLISKLVAPLSREGGVGRYVMEDPTDLHKVDIIRVMQLSPRHEYLVALPDDIRNYINFSYGLETTEEKEAVEADFEEILGELKLDEDIHAGEEDADLSESDSAIMRLANRIIMDAYTRGASDIHIEPYGKTRPTRIRLRVDGICGVYKEIPASHRKALVSRYKIMSNLDISERRRPQDGKIKIKTKKGLIELRVATLPSAGGEEDVVMRILAASKPMKLDDMGFSKRNLSVFTELVAKPYGIVLCVGPTGSGKTTTLHSALGHINTPERKIWTAEDPVEITQFGLRQVPVKAKIGVTFSTLLRAFLRADPDVIMIGEMRDEETAQIGIEASLTGHLVLSTLHTNSAPETVTRLIDLGVDPYSFADALLCVLAQRLARRLCKHCKKAYHPAEDEFQGIVAEYGEEHFDGLGIGYTKDLELFEAVGCKECNGTGYKGRMGIHELLAGTDEVKRVIQKKSPVEEVRDRAIEDGMTTLMQDGIRKVFLGITDMKQIRGVCIR